MLYLDIKSGMAQFNNIERCVWCKGFLWPFQKLEGGFFVSCDWCYKTKMLHEQYEQYLHVKITHEKLHEGLAQCNCKKIRRRV